MDAEFLSAQLHELLIILEPVFHDGGIFVLHAFGDIRRFKPLADSREHHHLDGEHGHSHTHTHPHTQTKAVLNRLSRAIGHLESVKRMIEDGRDCTEVLIQIAAVRSALSSTAKVILKDHLEHCITDDQSSGDQLQALNEAIDKFM